MESRDESSFQGVICCCLDTDRSVEDTIHKLIDLKSPIANNEHAIKCFNIDLKNKYYHATIQLIDYEDLLLLKNNDGEVKEEVSSNQQQPPPSQPAGLDILNDCHAIILYGNGQTMTTNKLDRTIEELAEVGGEPRILLYDGIGEECRPYGSLQEWSIKNGYDFIDAADEEASKLLIDSLSAYKWVYRLDKTGSDQQVDKPKLNEELMQKLADFDTLLGKLSAYRDKPELRGNPEDKNIVEIADLLSGLLGDDVDDFLEAGGSGADKEPNDDDSTQQAQVDQCDNIQS